MQRQPGNIWQLERVGLHDIYEREQFKHRTIERNLTPLHHHGAVRVRRGIIDAVCDHQDCGTQIVQMFDDVKDLFGHLWVLPSGWLIDHQNFGVECEYRCESKPLFLTLS